MNRRRAAVVILDRVIHGLYLAAIGLCFYVGGYAGIQGKWAYVAAAVIGAVFSTAMDMVFRRHVMEPPTSQADSTRDREGCGTYGKLRGWGLGSRWIVGPVLRGYRAVRRALAKGAGNA